MVSYPENPKEYWDNTIRSDSRYQAVGNRGLPNAFNKARKENTISSLERIGAEHIGGFENKLVLDAGCGTGIYSEFYDNKGAEVSGVDISDEAIADIKNRDISGEFQQSELRNLPFSDDEFDVTHCFSVLYHIVNDAEWKESLREIVRVTRPGGKILLRVDWREEQQRIAEHLKHRHMNQYLRILAREHNCQLEGIYHFKDIPQYQFMFESVQAWPIRRLLATYIRKRGKWKVNPNQRVVVFEK